MHTRLVTSKTGQRGKMETAPDGGWFSSTSPACTPAWANSPLWPCLLHDAAPQWDKGCHGLRKAHLWGTKVAETRSRISAGLGQPLLVLTQAAHQNQPRFLTAVSAVTAPAQIHVEHLHKLPLLSTAPLWGEDANAGREENTHLKRIKPTWTKHSGLLVH